jgi:hypothetical protein
MHGGPSLTGSLLSPASALSRHPAIRTTGRLTFAPAGLSPAEHASLYLLALAYLRLGALTLGQIEHERDPLVAHKALSLSDRFHCRTSQSTQPDYSTTVEGIVIKRLPIQE